MYRACDSDADGYPVDHNAQQPEADRGGSSSQGGYGGLSAGRQIGLAHKEPRSLLGFASSAGLLSAPTLT